LIPQGFELLQPGIEPLIAFLISDHGKDDTTAHRFLNLQTDYRDQGLRIVGITYPPQTLAQVRRFAGKMRFNYPVALGTNNVRDVV